jgi:hypothetical protein
MAQRFDPGIGEPLSLFGETFTFQPHPAAPAIRYSAEASRATVYQVASIKSGELFALKVFRQRFRDPGLVEVQKRLERLGSLPGLSAARRRVVLPSEPAASDFPELQFAMLMPWIQGTTWFDLLIAARDRGYHLPLREAIRLCEQFLLIVRELEQRKAAHADISPGNVVVDAARFQIELLDLEELYLPGVQPPVAPILGSTGYRHPSAAASGGAWREEGDRYASAVMAAEILVLANPALARLAADEGYFAEDRDSDLGRDRFARAEPWLHKVAPEFLEVFRQSWTAPSLAECPPLWKLHSALLKAPVPLEEPVRAAAPAASESSKRAPARSYPRPRRSPASAWMAAALAMIVLVLTGLYTWSPTPPAIPDPPVVEGASPPAWSGDPASWNRFVTTFVGSREVEPGRYETLVLEIREIRATEGLGTFLYTLNAGGVRFENEGTLSFPEGWIELPDLGAGRFSLDGRGPALEGLPESGSWSLKGVP